MNCTYQGYFASKEAIVASLRDSALNLWIIDAKFFCNSEESFNTQSCIKQKFPADFYWSVCNCYRTRH